MYHIKSTVFKKFGRPRHLFTCSLSIPAPLTSLKLATSKSCSGYAFFIRELPGKSPESYLTINKIIKLIYVSLVSLLLLSVRHRARVVEFDENLPISFAAVTFLN